MKKRGFFIAALCALLALVGACGGKKNESSSGGESSSYSSRQSAESTMVSSSEAEQAEKCLLVGDSLFDYWKEGCQSALAGAPDLTNIGVGGSTSAFWLLQLAELKNENPTQIVVCVGTNNIGLGQMGVTAATGREGLQPMLNKFHEACPNAYIYFLTIPICGEETRWGAREETKTCNELMRSFCEKKEWAEIVETEYAFYDDEDYTKKPNPEYFTGDYLHFSPKGYEVLGGILRGALGLENK